MLIKTYYLCCPLNEYLLVYFSKYFNFSLIAASADFLTSMKIKFEESVGAQISELLETNIYMLFL